MSINTQADIIHLVHSLSGGGTERSLITLLSGMRLCDMQQRVVTLRHAGLYTSSLPNHVSCQPLGKIGRSRFAYASVAKLIHDYRTLIHARNTCCWTDATLAAILRPHVSLVLGFHGLEIQGKMPPRHRWIARLAYYLGGSFLSVTEAGKNKLYHETGIPLARISVIRTGIDRKKYRPAADENRIKARQILRLSADTIAIGCVGSFTSIKNHEQLLNAFAKIHRTCKRATLVLIGEGPQGASLRRLSEQLGIETHVRWLGQCEEVASILPALDMYVCCSYSEGISNAMLEAMACGLPIVTHDVGDHRLVVRHGLDGLVVEESTADALARALLTLIGKDMRRVMGLSARKQTKHFDISYMIAKYESFYRRCLFPTGATLMTKNSHTPLRKDTSVIESVPSYSKPAIATSGNARISSS